MMNASIAAKPSATWLKAALVLGPVGLLVNSALLPSLDEKLVASQHPGLYEASVLAAIIGSGALLLGYTVLAAQVADRFRIFGTITLILVFVGNTVALADWGTELVKRQMGVSGLDPKTIDALWDQLDTAPGVMGPLQVGGIATLIGFILLGIGIARAKLGPTWAAVVLPLAVIGNIVAYFPENVIMQDIANVALVAAGIGLARASTTE